MKKYSLETIVFLAGAAVMILEIIGSRLLAPYLGTSLPVWTGIIGVVLAALSFGYWSGGKIADKRADMPTLALILLFVGLCVGATSIIDAPVLSLINLMHLPLSLSATLATLLLLAPASVFLGIISPYAVRLKLQALQATGRTVGNLSALSTIGSIAGTFLSGFFLLGYLGTHKILIVLTILLLLLSLLAQNFRGKKSALAWLFIVLFIGSFGIQEANGAIDIDTAYSRVWIRDEDGIRTMYQGSVSHSAMSLTNPEELIFPYTRYYRLIKHFKPDTKEALMLGGGGYSYPKDFLRNFPKAHLDVVEIDPGITALAKQYFSLKDDPRLTSVNADGRVFLNENKKTYDAIFGDAFGSYYSIPFQLATLEAAEKEAGALSANGVMIMNIVSALEGEKSKFLRAEYATLKNVFPQVYVFPIAPSNPYATQNIMLVAMKGDDVLRSSLGRSTDPELDGYLKARWQNPIPSDLPILTDDFAPVDQYINDL